ncbi:MAG: hypothetical protein ACLPMG_16210, partial [Terriglobales bacterium]
QGVIVRNSLLGADVAEHVQLLLVFSAHAFFLSGCAVETREFRGTASASNRVFPQPVRGRVAQPSFSANC